MKKLEILRGSRIVQKKKIYIYISRLRWSPEHGEFIYSLDSGNIVWADVRLFRPTNRT